MRWDDFRRSDNVEDAGSGRVSRHVDGASVSPGFFHTFARSRFRGGCSACVFMPLPCPGQTRGISACCARGRRAGRLRVWPVTND